MRACREATRFATASRFPWFRRADEKRFTIELLFLTVLPGRPPVRDRGEIEYPRPCCGSRAAGPGLRAANGLGGGRWFAWRQPGESGRSASNAGFCRVLVEEIRDLSEALRCFPARAFTRKRRFQLFLDLLRPNAATHLYFGRGRLCVRNEWQGAGDRLPRVLCLNVDPATGDPAPGRITCEDGDGRNLRFADGSLTSCIPAA